MARSAWITAALAGLGLLSLAACQNGPTLPHVHMPSIESPPVCADFSITIYFEPASSVVTADADALIRSAAGRTRRCKVTSAEVVGLADAAGADAANLQISKDRAAAVTAALAKHGFSIVNVSEAAAGETGAQAQHGVVRPLRRRADVTFHLEAKPAG